MIGRIRSAIFYAPMVVVGIISVLLIILTNGRGWWVLPIGVVAVAATGVSTYVIARWRHLYSGKGKMRAAVQAAAHAMVAETLYAGSVIKIDMVPRGECASSTSSRVPTECSYGQQMAIYLAGLAAYEEWGYYLATEECRTDREKAYAVVDAVVASPEQAQAYLDAAYSLTRALLRARWLRLLALAAELMKCEEMDGDSVRRILSQDKTNPPV